MTNFLFSVASRYSTDGAFGRDNMVYGDRMVESNMARHRPISYMGKRTQLTQRDLVSLEIFYNA